MTSFCLLLSYAAGVIPVRDGRPLKITLKVSQLLASAGHKRRRSRARLGSGSGCSVTPLGFLLI